jgi:hypothetical protein
VSSVPCVTSLYMMFECERCGHTLQEVTSRSVSLWLFFCLLDFYLISKIISCEFLVKWNYSITLRKIPRILNQLNYYWVISLWIQHVFSVDDRLILAKVSFIHCISTVLIMLICCNEFTYSSKLLISLHPSNKPSLTILILLSNISNYTS